MNYLKLEKESERLLFYIKVKEKALNRFNDIVKRIEIEEAKSSIQQYLTVSKSWYLEQKHQMSRLLPWVDNRIRTIISNIEKYGATTE